MKKYKQLTAEERNQLALWKANGISNKESVPEDLKETPARLAGS